MDLKFYVGKYKSSNSYTKRADQTITRVGLLLPFAMVIYGLLIQFNIIPSPNNSVDIYGFAIIMTVWMFIGIWQTIKPGNTAISSTIRLLEFYTMSGVYFILVSGVYNPFVVCWPILMLASYTYFETTGLNLGILAFILIIITDIFFFHPNDPKIIISDIMLFVTIMITGLAIITVMRTHEIRKEKLFKNIIKESLQRDRVATIVNNLTDAIISTDANGSINVYNAASMALLDTNINLTNHNIDKVLPLVDQGGKHISVINEFKKAKTVVRRDDLNLIFSDGETIRLETTYTPIRHGYNRTKKGEIQDGYIIIMRDITKAKSLEEERNEFISVISHELRTPITITEGTISNVQEMMGHPNATNSMIRDAIIVAHDQVLFLANIVNDLSALSRAERGADDDPEDIDIHDLISGLIEQYKEDAKDKKIYLKLSIDPKADKIYASKTYLEQLLRNLISNGIKFTRKGGVKIKVEETQGVVTFKIIDTGIGISKTDQSKIFNKFYRSEDFRTRESGGTGLGLYVASKIASHMGSKIELESKINSGSTFKVSLPKNFTKKGDKNV